MQKVKLAMLALIAVFAFGAVAVASASAALPEFVPAKGTFPVHFTSEGQLPLLPRLESLITALGSMSNKNIICLMSKDVGELSGPKEVKKVLVDYTGCSEEKESKESSSLCYSGSTKNGLIVTNDIMGFIGYITGAGKTKVGVELLPESGKIFAEFTCEGEAKKVKVEGCLVGEASPLNVSQTTGTLLFLANATDTAAEYEEIEGGIFKPCKLTTHAGLFEAGEGPSWNMDNETETFSEAVELKA
jgi:hypothetical protein